MQLPGPALTLATNPCLCPLATSNQAAGSVPPQMAMETSSETYVTACPSGILILASQQELPGSLLLKATDSETLMVAHVYALGLSGHNNLHRARRPGQPVLAFDEPVAALR